LKLRISEIKNTFAYNSLAFSIGRTTSVINVLNAICSFPRNNILGKNDLIFYINELINLKHNYTRTYITRLVLDKRTSNVVDTFAHTEYRPRGVACRSRLLPSRYHPRAYETNTVNVLKINVFRTAVTGRDDDVLGCTLRRSLFNEPGRKLRRRRRRSYIC